MQRYENLSGNSGVTAFELRDQALVVEFQDGWKYLYTLESVGATALWEMRRLALMGKGLSSYISQSVRDAYAKKFR